MRYFRRGVSQAVFVPTLADQTSPTQAEIAAGTNVSAAVNSITGFTTDTSRISEAVLAYRQNPQIDGEQTYGNAAMKLMEDDGVTGPDSTVLAATYEALADEVVGYMILSPGATAATKKGEVWPVKVGSNNRDWDMGNVFAKYDVAFAITGVPTKNATFAA